MKTLLPTSDLAKRLCNIFHRRHTTPWQPKEKRVFLQIRDAITEEDLLNHERRYKTLWPPGRDKNTLRHDLYTFMNNYAPETDRSNIWAEQHPIRKERKIIPIELPGEQPPLSAEEQASADLFMEQYRMRKRAKESA